MSLDVSVLSQEDAGSPLYLTTACHRLIELGIYEEMDDEIAKLKLVVEVAEEVWGSA